MLTHSANTIRHLIIALSLLVVTAATFARLGTCDFVNYDDNDFITANSQVKAGMTWAGTKDAFTGMTHGTFMPLTTLSHMLDVELFGLNPGRHHLVNLFFHVASTLTLFLALSRMTRDVWCSAFVAALFAVHPLHVESVAWLAERKDVLNTFFGMLAIFAYGRYAESPGPARYLAVLLTFGFSLLAKPMLVTLPLLLILLDFWPLRRIAPLRPAASASPLPMPSFPLSRIVLEKVPLLLMAAMMSVVTYVGQSTAGAVHSGESGSLTVNAPHALLSYVHYLVKMVWPTHLAVFYPHPGDPAPLWQAAGAALLLLAATAFSLVKGRRHPYLAVGWLWYLVSLMPVIGLVRIGSHDIADRYTYVTLIGIFLIGSWGIDDLTRNRQGRSAPLALVALALVAVLVFLSWRQTGYWLNSETLFRHAIEATGVNALAHNHLGSALQERGELEAAITQFEAALSIRPAYPEASYNLASACDRLGNEERALFWYRKAIELRPDDADAHNNIAVLYMKRRMFDPAVEHYRAAVNARPQLPILHDNLGQAYRAKGMPSAATAEFRRALELAPADAGAHNHLGIALLDMGLRDQAAAEFQEAQRLDPRIAEYANNLYRAQAPERGR